MYFIFKIKLFNLKMEKKFLNTLPLSSYNPMEASFQDRGLFSSNILSPKRHDEMIKFCVWRVYFYTNKAMFALSPFSLCRVRVDFVLMQFFYIYGFFRKLVFLFILKDLEGEIRAKVIENDFFAHVFGGADKNSEVVVLEEIRMLTALQHANTMPVFKNYLPHNKRMYVYNETYSDPIGVYYRHLPDSKNDMKILKKMKKMMKTNFKYDLKYELMKELREINSEWESSVLRNFIPIKTLVDGDFLKLHKFFYSSDTLIGVLRSKIIMSYPYDIFTGMVDGMHTMVYELEQYLTTDDCASDKKNNCSGVLVEKNGKDHVYAC